MRRRSRKAIFKSDGTVDRRFSVNKGLRVDGTPDLRYKRNRRRLGGVSPPKPPLPPPAPPPQPPKPPPEPPRILPFDEPDHTFISQVQFWDEKGAKTFYINYELGGKVKADYYLYSVVMENIRNDYYEQLHKLEKEVGHKLTPTLTFHLDIDRIDKAQIFDVDLTEWAEDDIYIDLNYYVTDALKEF